MTIASEISKLNNNLLDAYSAIGTKGGTVPANKNTDNLTTAINSIPAGSPGITDSSILITGYDTTTGVITGSNFGTTGKVYLLDRDTHTYNELTTSAYTNTAITLTSPINRATIQGNTCFYVQPTNEGISNKFMVYGDGTLTVPQYGLVYVQDEATRAVTKITCASTTDLGRLQGVNNTFGNSVTINGTTIYKSTIVGFQFGPSASGYTVPTLFLAQLSNLNQPVVFITGVVTSASSTYLLRYNYQFDCPVVFNDQNRVGNYFMYGCRIFNQPLDISGFAYITGTYFLYECNSFNQELKLPTTLTTTTIANYFMYNCYSFDKELTFPTNLTGVGNYFMYYCYSFNQKVTLPNTVTTIGTYFLARCYSFNSDIYLGTKLTTVGTYFMNYCQVFNRPLVFPSTFTTTQNYFMAYCYSFNSLLTMPGLKTIGDNFLYITSYNQSMAFMSGVTSIGNNFLFQNYAINQPITLSSQLTTIGTQFMLSCTAFNQKLTIPSSVTSIGTGFMNGCYSFGLLEVNNSTSPTDANSLSVASYNSNRMYQGGITVTGTGRTTWLTNLPNSATSPYRNLINGGA